ncbi:Phosphoglycerate dehydrogenase [Rhodococcus rhodochrous J3]|uniref:Dehydrogenase n=3 Tax=Rhodococcus TaxID=1827 RepID=A0A379LZD2_9NOCA|nr:MULTISPECIES: D-isomer specific 2-hydroxyacid dehydrogenase family protein [Rhodococcus]AYA27254.1 hydroxyacid dehydrogenase [Rhodococcus rhodochrous]MBF4479639.1 hydroxyacid dehydrogenase [Rhodococcus rhodochrous]MCD2096791.1 D-isomer specific 2-hydroxyacid dehydrogenase family protein [Rhodococcus rhodochrous]MCD2110670.1 D-isomer specific 2-hydroxyacid dehydrogenase family protein [Rhodococcus rhodochrous]MCD2118409.1 D-isomer specific 2-hydroxyacid dehydrogenase family protein [Rhodococ
MRIHLGPGHDEHLAAAIVSGGGTLSELDEADALVWDGSAEEFPDLPDRVRWVQLTYAGIEPFFRAGVIDDRRLWANASGVYADNVAEYAVGALLVGLRQFHASVAAKRWTKDVLDPRVRTLHGSTVAIVGCGGIGRAMIPRLHALGASVVAVNRSGRPVDGAKVTLPADRTSEVWSMADHFVVAAPATAETDHLVDAAALAAMPGSAWLVNVARGNLVDTDALVKALGDGAIAGAVLDVTDPEPLPDGHPLWDLDNAVITPHIANTRSRLTQTFAPTLEENVRRFAAGEELIARVDPNAGY